MARTVKLKSETKKKGGFAKFLFHLLLISFLGVVIYLLFFSRYLAITDISISGLENIQEADIKNEIQNGLSGKFFNILEKNNLLLAKTSYYEKDLAQKFKKIDIIKIKRKFPSDLIVSITEKKLKMIFCSNEKCFILDDHGNAFEEIGKNSEGYNSSSLAILTDSSNLEIKAEDEVFSPQYISFAENVRNKMEKELDIFTEREFSTPNRISGDLRMIAKDGWAVYFDANLDAQKEIEMLKAILDEKIPRDQRINLEYIDLRSENKVFYKFKEGTQEEVKTEEEKTADEQPKEEKKEKKKK